jgi:deoxyribodipyrimidine photolyase-related protein
MKVSAPDNTQSIPDNLRGLLRHYRAQRLELQQPDEWRLDAKLQAFCAKTPYEIGVECSFVESNHFYTQRLDAARLFQGRGSWLMETFYRHLRRTHRVLLDAAGQPEGGRWNFDADNRKPWRGPPQHPAQPPDPRPLHDHSAFWAEIEAAGVVTVGNPQAQAFRWPINRSESLALLQAFIVRGLPHFGDFQDAMHHQAPRLFHCLLSFSLNTKMLQPQEVVQAAEAAYRAGQAPLQAVEGFIRQILGWREYVRGFYWAHAPQHGASNVFGHSRPLPGWFWTGQTRMACMASAIGQTLETAYAHHIQRLMVIGNFALLAGLDPAEVDRWYLGVYIDAFAWVEQPNTLGMSQWADGGRLATKPYVSTAAYIDRMSNYCKGCAYDKKLRQGDAACPFIHPAINQ